MTDLKNFEEEISSLENKSLELNYLRNNYLAQKDTLSKEVSNLEEESILLVKVSELFKHLLDTLLDKKKQDIEKLVTYGLKSVFTDQDLKFHIDIEPKYSGIYTSFRTEEVGAADGDVLENFGGGLVNLESYLLRVLTISQTKLAPFLILDESFSHVSEDYVENCSKLLNSMCENFGLTIFLVTHQETMLNYAHKVYKASSQNNVLNLEEIKS